MHGHGMLVQYLVAARSAGLAIGALAVAHAPIWAAADCQERNAQGFFESATRADIIQCLDNGKSLMQPDRPALTPLHHASLHSGPLQVLGLLERRVGLVALDDDGRTALHRAAVNDGAPESVTILPI